MTDHYEVHHIGIGYKGPVAEVRGVSVHPCNLRGGDVFGAYQAREFVERYRPEVVFLLNDVWILEKYARTLTGLGGRTKTVCYCPLDGEVLDGSLIEPLAAFDRLVVYTEFARREIERAASRSGVSLPLTEVIPHGVDTEVFRPLAGGRSGARKLLFPEEPRDSFIVLNANRFQPRKRIDLTIEGFARFARGKPPGVKLCLHHAITDEEERTEVSRLADSRGIADRLIVSFGSRSDEELNLLYNACDVGVNTTMGEGWGLVSFEHAATGAAQVVPNHSACAGLWKGAAELLEPVERYVPDYSLLQMRAVSPEGVAAALERLYANRKYRREMSLAALRNATRPEYRWDEISRRWRRLFDEAAKDREPLTPPGMRGAARPPSEPERTCTCYTLFVDDGGWFDWDEGNEDHISGHGVDPAEVEEAVLDPEGFGVDAYDVPGEQREALVGATGEGRVLFIVYTIRGRERIRPITARDASDVQKRKYRRGGR